jgi:Uma2 family endonuclease
MITDINQLDFSKEYTYADYLTWQFKERVELIKGRIFKMSPAPNRKHQAISGEIFYLIKTFLRKKHCHVFHAPFDVCLPLPKDKATGDKIATVVQPDITVICDESKLDEQGCNGAPDIVIEILSPRNSTLEMKDKYQLYQSAGILEYWLVAPEHEFVIIYTLNTEGKYVGSEPVTKEDTLESTVLIGLKIDLSEVF